MELFLYVWLTVSALFLIMEYATRQAVAIWVSVGALASGVIAGFALEWYYQILAFFVLPVGLTLLFRKPLLMRSDKNLIRKTVQSSVGKYFELLTPITATSAGTIRVDEIILDVLAKDGNVIPENSTVFAVGFKGNRLLVEKVNK